MKIIHKTQRPQRTPKDHIKDPSVFVKPDFKVIDDRILDSKGRITISNDWVPTQVRSFKIYRNGDGDLLLRPEVSIPAREAWIFENPQVLSSLKRGLNDSKEGKGEVVGDIDAYLKGL